MRIELQPGEELEVGFTESDGTIIVAYTDTALTVSADLPDSTGREGTIYEERLGVDEGELKEVGHGG